MYANCGMRDTRASSRLALYCGEVDRPARAVGDRRCLACLATGAGDAATEGFRETGADWGLEATSAALRDRTRAARLCVGLAVRFVAGPATRLGRETTAAFTGARLVLSARWVLARLLAAVARLALPLDRLFVLIAFFILGDAPIFRATAWFGITPSSEQWLAESVPALRRKECAA